MKALVIAAAVGLALGVASAPRLSAQSFPEGDVAAYIDAVDAVTLPARCKARMIVVDIYSTGTEKTSEGFFVRKDNKVVWVATAPASQKNFALLRNEDVFYERFATTNKVVKTSATASSRGGETSNLDLTRFNTNLDYTARYVGEGDVGGAACYEFELRAKNRKLAYSLVHLWVDKATKVPVKKAFYAISEKVLKYYTVTRSTLKNGRVAEMQMEYVDALKPTEKSRLRLYDVTPLESVPDQFFTKEYLESGRLFPYDF